MQNIDHLIQIPINETDTITIGERVQWLGKTDGRRNNKPIIKTGIVDRITINTKKDRYGNESNTPLTEVVTIRILYDFDKKLIENGWWGSRTVTLKKLSNIKKVSNGKNY